MKERFILIDRMKLTGRTNQDLKTYISYRGHSHLFRCCLFFHSFKKIKFQLNGRSKGLLTDRKVIFRIYFFVIDRMIVQHHLFNLNFILLLHLNVRQSNLFVSPSHELMFLELIMRKSFLVLKNLNYIQLIFKIN